MHFLDSLNSITPLVLRPDRPASQYMLSYDEVVCQQASKHLEHQKNRQQLIQIDKLSEIIRQKDREKAQQETSHLERQFLFQIEIERLRRILCEWDAQRRKYQEDIRTKQQIYQNKLQEIKQLLSNQLTQKVDEIRGENKRDLERIKELYDVRVAKLHQHTYKQEHRMKVLQMQAGSKHNRLQMSEGERQKLQAILLLKQDKLNEMETIISQFQSENRKLKEQNERLYDTQHEQIEYLKHKNQQKLNQYEQMKALVIGLQNTVEQLRVDKEQYSDIKRKLTDKINSLQIKCETLQQQVQQFRSRKTQHNGFAREASINTISHNQSDRQQLSAMKDNRSLARLKRPFAGQTMEIANIEEQYPQKQQLDKTREIQYQLARKEEQCQELIIAGEQLKKSIEEQQREINRLKTTIHQLQNKLNEKDSQILKLHNELEHEKEMNDGGKMEKVWLERLQKAQQALQILNQQWLMRQRELAALFKKIESTYKTQLQKSKQAEQLARKETQQMTLVMMQKIKQLSTK